MIKKSIFILLFFMGFISCKKEIVKEKSNEVKILVSSVKTYNYNELKPLLEKKDDKIYIVNFWATWCAPCVKELPYFDSIKQKYTNKNVEILLVSLDSPKQVDKKLIPFINEHKILSQVVLLDDINEDVWIKAIDESWSGTLPATLIYTKNSRKFYKGAIDYKTLESELLLFLN
jgi:thiol-disulfide isomerase/thioredoxin